MRATWSAGLVGVFCLSLAAALAADANLPDVDGLKPPGLSQDLSVWPNVESCRNADDWLWQNHDKIRKMKPRVIVINFANDVDMAGIRQRCDGFVKAFAEGTKYHGFDNPDAPAFIEYEVVKYVDLRDPNAKTDPVRKSSSLMPRQTGERIDAELDYAALYSDDFAAHYGFKDPRTPGRYLNLHELINAGFVHELWFYAIHDGNPWPGRETAEFKRYYDDNCKPIEGKYGPAGNGHTRTMPWSGRSFRIAFFNPHRGIGCMMENYGHTLEAIANHNAVAYYKKYFDEFAELNLKDRFGLPFRSFYRLPYQGEHVSYPEPNVAVFEHDGKQYRLDPYINIGGNVHWPPGARKHYDRDSPYKVISRIENYRLRNGENGQDKTELFHHSKWARYEEVAPDCMGAWTIYWRQCMPGLDNKALDDDGKPMKNWWVFLFY